MVQYVITPWRSRDELLHVRSVLYPTTESSVSEDERRHAVTQVGVWTQRGNCPHLVESSAILWSAILNDIPDNSTYCVRAAYAAAFCRFVTGLLDSHQDKRRKLSMYSIAKTLGLPATYVELRHQATHEELPSLAKLRIATQKALKWIYEYYWKHLQADTESKDSSKAHVEDLVREEDDSIRARMEEFVGHWNDDLLLGILIEIQGATDDILIMSRASRLQRLISGGNMDAVTNGKKRKLEPPLEQSMDEIKLEIEKMNDDLDNTMDEVFETGPEHNEIHSGQSSKGWTMWEGPWIPKPIGIV